MQMAISVGDAFVRDVHAVKCFKLFCHHNGEDVNASKIQNKQTNMQYTASIYVSQVIHISHITSLEV